jgi:predicted MFS family arabinose efflux permease
MTTKAAAAFDRREWALIFGLLVAGFAIFTGVQMGSALFPGLARLWSVPVTSVAKLASIWGFAGMLAPLLGPLSDRFGHWTLFFIGSGVYVAGNALSGQAPGLGLMMAAQAFVGLGYATFGFTAPAIVGEVYAYETRGRAMGLIRLGVSGASLVGVPIAAALAESMDPRYPYTLVAILAALSIVPLLPLSSRFRGRGVRRSPESARVQVASFFRLLASRRSACVGLAAVAIWAAIPTGVFIYLAAWLEERFALTGSMIGVAFLFVGCGALLGNLMTAGMADRIGKKRSSIAGLVGLSMAAIILPHVSTVWLAMAVLCLLTAVLEFGYGSFSTLMTEQIPEQRGTLLSMAAFVNGLGTAAVPLVGGSLWARGGYASVTFVVGALGLAAALVLVAFLGEPASVAADPECET